MTPQQKAILLALIEAAKPFTNSDIVDETSGTIPLMEMLRRAIESAEKALEA